MHFVNNQRKYTCLWIVKTNISMLFIGSHKKPARDDHVYQFLHRDDCRANVYMESYFCSAEFID